MVSADPVRLFEALVESGQVGGGEPVGGPRLLIELPSGSRLVAESPLQFSDGGGFGGLDRPTCSRPMLSFSGGLRCSWREVGGLAQELQRTVGLGE